LDAPRAEIVGVDDDGHAGDVVRFGRTDGQRFDVEAAAPHERGHARQHAGHVFDEYDEGVHASAPVSTIGLGLGRRIMLCRSLPAGTIGKTESSCSTWKSITTVP